MLWNQNSKQLHWLDRKRNVGSLAKGKMRLVVILNDSFSMSKQIRIDPKEFEMLLNLGTSNASQLVRTSDRFVVEMICCVSIFKHMFQMRVKNVGRPTAWPDELSPTALLPSAYSIWNSSQIAENPYISGRPPRRMKMHQFHHFVNRQFVKLTTHLNQMAANNTQNTDFL